MRSDAAPELDGAPTMRALPDAARAQAGSASTEVTQRDAAASARTDAAPRDAGRTVPTDAAVDACAQSLFCDAFEASTSLDPTRYSAASANCSGDGHAEVAADAHAHSGSQVLRVHSSGGYCNHVFVSPRLPAPLPARLYVRFFVRFDTALGDEHVTFVALHDAHDDKDLRLGGQKQVLIWNREIDDATLPELSPTGVALSSAPSAGVWHCIEFSIDTALPSIATYFDATALAGLTLDGQPSADIDRQWLQRSGWRPELRDLRLGWESYGSAANTLAFDDLVIGSDRIGCEASLR
jgi:polysaccharide lyase-like protein